MIHLSPIVGDHSWRYEKMNERLRQLRDAVLNRSPRMIEVDSNGEIRPLNEREEEQNSQHVRTPAEEKVTRLAPRTFGSQCKLTAIKLTSSR
jgi:hypothetical protein